MQTYENTSSLRQPSNENRSRPDRNSTERDNRSYERHNDLNDRFRDLESRYYASQNSLSDTRPIGKMDTVSVNNIGEKSYENSRFNTLQEPPSLARPNPIPASFKSRIEGILPDRLKSQYEMHQKLRGQPVPLDSINEDSKESRPTHTNY